MTDFEDQLRRAFERQEPSADFADRVVARASRPVKVAMYRYGRKWLSSAIAAALIVALGGGYAWERHRQGEEARAQLIQAMEITSSKLEKIHKKVQGALR